MIKKLKPCPFCGSHAELRDDGDDYSMEGIRNWWVGCGGDCLLVVGCFWTKDEAVIDWNTRIDTNEQD